MRIATISLGLLALLTPLTAAWSKEGESIPWSFPEATYPCAGLASTVSPRGHRDLALTLPTQTAKSSVFVTNSSPKKVPM
jgi:hypothetical protein